MIGIFKLEKLPRNQRLRKIASVISAAERKLCSGLTVGQADAVDTQKPIISTAEFRYYTDIIHFLSCDQGFSPLIREVFADAEKVLSQTAISGLAETNVQRTLNNVRHILLSETGRSQADWDFIGYDGHLDQTQRQVFSGMHVYLEDIRSPFNVGAMFRSAESFGVEKIYVSPLCADPNHVRARRTAMGCVEVLPWERQELFPDNTGTSGQPEPDIPVFALETGGTALADFSFPRQGLMIAGSEELGVSPRALSAADESLGRVSIPCFGAKGSLNVSVAFGIVLQAWAQAIKK